MSPERPPTVARVDLDAIAANFAALRRVAGVPVMAVVKADAYGHGLVPVARRLEREGAWGFGVATVDEALELREAGIESPILILGWTPPAAVAKAIRHGIRLTVFDRAGVDAAASAARVAGARAVVHVKVDTGMGRLGFPGWEPERAVAEILAALARPELDCEAVYTHFACADEPDPAPTEAQLSRFRTVLRLLAEAGFRPRLVHAANSAAAIRFPSARFDLVRCGIALYGIEPYPGAADAVPLRPALRWTTRVAQVRTIPAGWGVSYGHTFVAPQAMTVAVLPVGYGHGYPRALSNRGRVLVRGRPASVLGRVCMDQVVVGPVDPDLRPGEEVVLIGEQDGGRIRAEDAGEWAGTTAYEIVTRIGKRVPRVYG